MATIPVALQWPTDLEREYLLSWTPRFMNEYSPPTLDGTIQVRNTNGGGLWGATFGTVQLRSTPQILAWQALEIQAKGGLDPIDVPVLLCAQYPAHAVGETVFEVITVGAVAARAVAMRITAGDIAKIKAGMHFSDYDAAIYGWRLYRIATVAAVIGQPTQRDITFWPPLRFAAVDAHQLKFDAPRCVMRLAASDAMDLELDLRKRGNPSVSFVEAF